MTDADTASRAVVATRRTAGAIILLSLGWLAFTIVAAVRYQYRDHSGIAEAEAGLAAILERVESSYERSGHLCGSSRLELSHGFGGRSYLSAAEQATVDTERDANVGFACLGLSDLGQSRDMFSYESDGTTFRARAFRAYLFDPGGVLPRYEVSGRIDEGKLVVDRRVRRIEPGGPRFLGHPSEADL